MTLCKKQYENKTYHKINKEKQMRIWKEMTKTLKWNVIFFHKIITNYKLKNNKSDVIMIKKDKRKMIFLEKLLTLIKIISIILKR